MKTNPISYKNILGLLVVFFGSSGLYASVTLLLAKLEKLKNPGFVPPCSVNAWFDCGRVMDSKWGELFGYPNYINGIILYSLAIMTGLFILSNKRNDKRVMWFSLILAGIGLFANVVLMYISVFLIHAVCLWCVLSIVSTIGVFFAILEYMGWEGQLGDLENSSHIKKYLKWYHIPLLIFSYLFVFIMVFGVSKIDSIFPGFFEISWPNPIFWV
jgi:uncharacterized membrane protein